MKVVALLMLAVLAVATAERQNLIHLMPTFPTIPRNSHVRASLPNPNPKVRAPIPGTKKVENCGVHIRDTNPDSRIVNGHEATPHEFPWQVALNIDEIYFCGGSLISDEWVMTAAHCTIGSKSIEVQMGAQNRTKNETTQVIMTSTGDQIITHEGYDSTYLRNDIAVIHLPRPVTVTHAINAICLPSLSDANLGAGVNLTASGWGRTADGSLADTLNVVSNPSISNTECQQTYGSDVVTENVICVATDQGGDKNQGTCNGDSGGPLMHSHNQNEGAEVYSRGITSFGSSRGCESGLPNGYTRTQDYLEWIETNTGIAIDP